MSASVDVLLVEDEADLAAATRDYLSAFGLHVLHCPDAESALASAGARAPGVVLLDVNLPGMSGFELCRELRGSTRAPIIFVSARSADVDQVQGLSLGADDFITKPFSLAVLLAKVRRALERSADSPPARPIPSEQSANAPAALFFDDREIAPHSQRSPTPACRSCHASCRCVRRRQLAGSANQPRHDCARLGSFARAAGTLSRRAAARPDIVRLRAGRVAPFAIAPQRSDCALSSDSGKAA